MFKSDPERPPQYRRFDRATPEWYLDAKLGIFVHWGPYSVPAWAEPIGALGTIEKEYWFRHNPYAEWYYNTIRIEGAPAREHQQEVYGGAPYDDFLDAWTADRFDADDVLALVASTGARYFVPTTKHHDGVTLWDAPGTGDRNTVHRGPRRDLIEEFRAASEAAGVRFGVYYSGGLDWHVGQNPPITVDDLPETRPVDAEYAAYAFDHVADLVARYRPEVLWGDIEWPDAGKPEGPKSLVEMFDLFYAARPDGVVNDRWGETHWDFRTSEYENGLEVEGGDAWENCRGVGYSFGYNRLEDESTSLSGPAAIRHFVDVVARGGNFLLNIGLTAEGLVPELQRRTLEALGAFNAEHGAAIFGSRPAGPLASPSDPATEEGGAGRPWVRWTRSADALHAFVWASGDAPAAGPFELSFDPTAVDVASARLSDGAPVTVEVSPATPHDDRPGALARVLVRGVGAASPAQPVRIDFALA
ncbi:alpha-L-fucosidase [Herbiconiux sp. P16]|uniref:alpha-L-fucosidase n=1 Tax=Herbiconiux wuyangfengii TaxID=3342794 RepID=UPI0035B976F1